MKFKTRNFLWLIPLILLVSYPFWQQYAVSFLAPSGSIEGISDSVSSKQSGREFIMDEIVFSQFVKGKKEWSIDAQKLTTKKDETDIFMEVVKAAFWNADDKAGNVQPAIRITGKKARYDKNRQTMILTEKVIVTTEDGYEMQTEQLEFFEKNREFKATSGVRIDGRNLTVLGESLIYDMDVEKLFIEGGVTAEFQ